MDVRSVILSIVLVSDSSEKEGKDFLGFLSASKAQTNADCNSRSDHLGLNTEALEHTQKADTAEPIKFKDDGFDLKTSVL